MLVYPTTAGWVVQTSNAAEDLHDVFCDPEGRLVWVVGSGGLVLSSTDAGASWTRRTPSTYDLYGVWFTSATEGWAVGDFGTVLHTPNGRPKPCLVLLMIFSGSRSVSASLKNQRSFCPRTL